MKDPGRGKRRGVVIEMAMVKTKLGGKENFTLKYEHKMRRKHASQEDTHINSLNWKFDTTYSLSQ